MQSFIDCSDPDRNAAPHTRQHQTVHALQRKLSILEAMFYFDNSRTVDKYKFKMKF